MKIVIKSLRMTLLVAGSIFLLLVGLAFTSAPFWTWYRMAAKEAGINRPPDYLVLLGGGGMPSESALMRLWYTAGIAGYFRQASVIIALPGDTADKHSAINQMKLELILRGIPANRILLENGATNTRSQALNILKKISVEEELRHAAPIPSKVNRQSSILLITSPEHLYRAVLTFQKAGFLKVDGVPAFEQPVDSDISFNSRQLGGRKFIPGIGDNITLRYQFWTQMNYELLILREWAALGYYKLKNWI
ncbi:MAG: YdcF family protein [Bacteroidetes bacterium]|nr:YdcF family protein [Bacteroidota bacterium]